jgi:hypothetical protein
MFARCLVCGRKLRDPESLARGTGPVCDSILHPCTHKPRHIVTTVKEMEQKDERQLKLFGEGKNEQS